MSILSTVSIGQARFELATDSVARARAVQERVSVFARERLPALIETVLGTLGRATEPTAIDRIELDLGVLSETHLEAQLAEGVRRALAASMVRQRLARAAPPGGEPVEQDLPFLRHWLGAGTAAPTESAMQRALRACPDALLQLVRELGQRQAVRQRLAGQLTRAALEQLVRALEPGEAQLIIDYVAQTCQLHQRRPLVPENRRGFGIVLWEFVLSYLLLERGSYFQTRALVGHTLLQMAQRYQIGYADLLAHLASCLHDAAGPASARAGLAAILADLHSVAAPARASHVAAGEPPQRRTEALRHFLEYGIWPGGAAPRMRATLADAIGAVLDDCPDQLAALLRRTGTADAVRLRLARQVPERQLERIAALLEPQHGAWIAMSVRAIRQVQAREHLVPEQDARFGQSLWELVLGALLADRGSAFNTRSFVKGLLQQMAARYGLAYRVLLHAVIGAGFDAAPARHVGLAALLHTLRQECAPAGTPEKGVRTSALRHLLALPGEHRQQLRPGTNAAQLLAALEDGPAVAAVLAELEAELPEGIATAQPAPGQFARAAREFTIRSFRLARGSCFNNRSYVQGLLQRLCARHGVAYADLLRGLCERTAGAADDTPEGLPAILAGLRRESARPDGAASDVAVRAAADPLRDFLLHGRLAAHSGTLLRDGLRSFDAATLEAALRDGAHRNGLVERLVRYLHEAQLAELVQRLAPDYAGFIGTFLLVLMADARVILSRPGALHTLAWRAVLRVLLARPDGAHSSARLLAALLQLLAPALGLAPATLGARLRSQALRLALQHPRFDVLAELLGAGQGGAGRAAAAAPAQAPGAPARFALLLRYGMRAALEQVPGMDQSALLAHIGAALVSDAAAMRTVLRDAGRRKLERQRYAVLLPAPMRARALGLLLDAATAAHWQRWQSALARACASAGTAAGGEAYWERLLAAELLRAICNSKRRDAGLARYLGDLVARLAQRHNIDPATLASALRREFGTEAGAQALLEVVERAARAVYRPAVASAPLPPIPVAALAEGEPFHVTNAGLALLWPFLPKCFEMLGLQREGEFAGFGERCRAVHLLHYLVYGNTEANEDQLLLNKILCGVEAGAVLDTVGAPDNGEGAVAEQVLAAAIGHWDKLGDTDADGLRTTFLQRAGRLVRKENDWTLTVEPAAFDILMTTLPWSISRVRLSWMTGMLTVVWR